MTDPTPASWSGRPLRVVGLLLALVGGGPLLAQPLPPAVNFIILPDGNGAPASESTATIPLAPFGGPGQPAVFDFVEPITRNDLPRMTAVRTGTVWAFDLADLRLLGTDLGLGASLEITGLPGSPGVVTTSDPGGLLGAGSVLTLSAAVQLALAGAPSVSGFPSSGTLTVSGTLLPGNFHQVALLSGSISTLPGSQIALYVKQDLLPPGILFPCALDATVSRAERTVGVPEVLEGSCSLKRDAVDLRVFRLGPLSVDFATAPSLPITAAALAGGTLVFDPYTRNLSGTLSVDVGGIPATVVLDGVGEAFEGPVTTPTRIVIHEPSLGPLGNLHLELRRPELVPGGSTPILGQLYQPLVRAAPGLGFVMAASLTPVPGINTGVGDVYVELDALFLFSITPQNGIFAAMQGTLDPTGTARLSIAIPNEPMLAGLTFFLAGAFFDFGVGSYPVAVTNSHRVIL